MYGANALLVVDAGSMGVIRASLAANHWESTILTIAIVTPWSVWLRAPVRR